MLRRPSKTWRARSWRLNNLINDWYYVRNIETIADYVDKMLDEIFKVFNETDTVSSKRKYFSYYFL